jgi:hypothetical protein
MDAKIDDHDELKKKEKVEFSKFKLNKQMSFDVITKKTKKLNIEI